MRRSLFVALVVASGFVGAGAEEGKLGTLLIVSGVKDTPAILSELVQFRDEQGWSVVIAEVESADTDAIQRRIQEEATTNAGLSHILLIGSDERIPFGRRETYRTQEREHDLPVLTDDVYALCDESGAPQLAIGRFPTDEPEELRHIAMETVAYERTIGSLKPEAFLLCGRELLYDEPAMGFLSPQAVADKVSNAFLQNFREKVAPAIGVNAKTAFPGPDYFPNEKTIETVIDAFQRRPLMSVYAGHADRTQFTLQHDTTQPDRLTSQNLSEMKLNAISGPLFAGGCSMLEPEKDGAPSIGRILLQLENGPVAMAGFTRVNDDFVVMQFFEILQDEIVKSEPRTFGLLIRNLKQRIRVEPQSERSKAIQLLMLTTGTLVQNTQLDYRKAVEKDAALLTIYGDPTVTVMNPE